jgi:hypothetical protein
MSYDPNLADRLSEFAIQVFDGEAFRVTRANADPTAPPFYGGRWARPQNSDPGTAVLYTSLVREGALAEVTSYLADLTPLPKRSVVKVTRLAVTTSKTLRLVNADLMSLGVDMTRYKERDYHRTQEIGSTPRMAWSGRPHRAVGTLAVRQSHDFHRQPQLRREAGTRGGGNGRMARLGRGKWNHLIELGSTSTRPRL